MILVLFYAFFYGGLGWGTFFSVAVPMGGFRPLTKSAATYYREINHLVAFKSNGTSQMITYERILPAAPSCALLRPLAPSCALLRTSAYFLFRFPYGVTAP